MYTSLSVVLAQRESRSGPTTPVPSGGLYQRSGVLLLFLLTCWSTAVEADWLVKRLPSPPGTLERCVVESTPLPSFDGYQETQVAISVSREHLLVKARAPLDDSFGDLGLQVEKYELMKPDRVVDKRTALFATSYATVLEQFKRGSAPARRGQKSVPSTVRVRLRFWPSWPATGVHTTEFSLDGFSEAYAEMLACK